VLVQFWFSYSLCWFTFFNQWSLLGSFCVYSVCSHVCTGSIANHQDAPTPRKPPPPPTPVRFPQCTPKAEDSPQSVKDYASLVLLLQGIHRPSDIKLSHFESLGIHVIPDTTPQELIPDPKFLPPAKEWNAIPLENLPEANKATQKPLSNGNLSPGVQTYRDRQREILIDNTAAFRSIRRIPSPNGEPTPRLGNSYEFFKNLEYFSSYWHDTSLPTPEIRPSTQLEEEPPKATIPPHLQTHLRTGTGAQLPPDYRQHILTAFIKLVAYDFGCNVAPPRCEPRLQLTPPPPSPLPPSYFNSAVSFIYRTPIDRSSARSGIVEGPVAAISSRQSTVFSTKGEELLDLGREIVAILLTAQQRAREHKTESRFGEGKWWTTKPRWGGGPGGAIGREADPPYASSSSSSLSTDVTLPTKPLTTIPSSSHLDPTTGLSLSDAATAAVVATAASKIGGIAGPSPQGRTKKSSSTKDGNLAIYAKYRKLEPPTSTWDRRARYMQIGKYKKDAYDDIFLISCLNHHICILRGRIPNKLTEALSGGISGEEGLERAEGVKVWRSKWYDLFLKEDRVEAMDCVWGMMAWLMRADTQSEAPRDKSAIGGGNDMDMS
jgi:hypothetical protein